MIDKPSEIQSDGRQGCATNSGNVTNLGGVNSKHRQAANAAQNHQKSLAYRPLLDHFERVNRIVHSSDDPDQICAQFLAYCREVFACDQLWLASAAAGSWSIRFSSCRPQNPLDSQQSTTLSENLSPLFQQLQQRGSPLCLSAASCDPIPVAVSESSDCHSLLLLPLAMSDGDNMLLAACQCSQTRIWQQDEIRLLQELAQRLSDGLNRLLSARLSADIQQRLLQLQQNTLNSIPLALVGIDTTGRICQWNQQAATLLGIEPQVALNRPWQELLPELPLEQKKIETAISAQAVTHLGRYPWSRQTPARLLELTLYPIAAEATATALIQLEDATERSQIEEFSIQQEKMASVGNLAAGVAHEINNPLAGILQNLQVMRNRLHPNLPKNIELAESCGLDIDQLDQYIKDRGILAILNAAIESGQQAADIVHNMLNFSRKDDCGFQNQRLSSLLDKAVELATSNFNLSNRFDFRKIEIVRHYAPDLPDLYCSPGQLQQVFLNLLNNSAHAMSKRLHFWEKNSATLPSSEKPRFILRLYQKDQALICEIEDNGCGMEEEVRKRVFEPFYTSKQDGSGTGLGMSICYFIVNKNHNGRMSVDSTPDVGSKFTLEFPLPATIT